MTDNRVSTGFSEEFYQRIGSGSDHVEEAANGDQIECNNCGRCVFCRNGEGSDFRFVGNEDNGDQINLSYRAGYGGNLSVGVQEDGFYHLDLDYIMTSHCQCGFCSHCRELNKFMEYYLYHKSDSSIVYQMTEEEEPDEPESLPLENHNSPETVSTLPFMKVEEELAEIAPHRKKRVPKSSQKKRSSSSPRNSRSRKRPTKKKVEDDDNYVPPETVAAPPPRYEEDEIDEVASAKKKLVRKKSSGKSRNKKSSNRSRGNKARKKSPKKKNPPKPKKNKRRKPPRNTKNEDELDDEEEEEANPIRSTIFIHKDTNRPYHTRNVDDFTVNCLRYSKVGKKRSNFVKQLEIDVGKGVLENCKGVIAYGTLLEENIKKDCTDHGPIHLCNEIFHVVGNWEEKHWFTLAVKIEGAQKKLERVYNEMDITREDVGTLRNDYVLKIELIFEYRNGQDASYVFYHQLYDKDCKSKKPREWEKELRKMELIRNQGSSVSGSEKRSFGRDISEFFGLGVSGKKRGRGDCEDYDREEENPRKKRRV